MIPGSGRSHGEGISYPLQCSWASLVAQQTWVQSLGWEDPLEKGKATRSSILAWKILAGRPLCSPWGHKELHTTEQLSLHQLEETHEDFLLGRPDAL